MRARSVLLCATLVATGVIGGSAVSQATTATRSPARVSVTFHKVVGGLSSPVYVTSARDGSRRLFVVQQGGSVRVVQKGAVQSRAYLNLTSEVLSGGEQGLLSIVLHPRFRAHPLVFAAYTRSDGALQVSRFKASSAAASTVARSTEVRLFAVPHPNQTNHNGGQLMFGRDGYLYVTTGDGGGGGDPYGNAERLTSLSGKILRLDVDHACGSRRYCIPAGNPFPHARSASKRLVFHWGLRNPWRASVDLSDGSLWIGEVGQRLGGGRPCRHPGRHRLRLVVPGGARRLQLLALLRPHDASPGHRLRPLEQPAGGHRWLRLPRSDLPVRPRSLRLRRLRERRGVGARAHVDGWLPAGEGGAVRREPGRLRRRRRG
jgi:glucose/arabinose dehydrogenase